jgi:hypothetical protein
MSDEAAAAGMAPILAVHGIWNRIDGMSPDEAARTLAGKWQPALAAGYTAAGLDGPPPGIVAAYYADLLATHAQGGLDDLGTLSPAEQRWAWAWMKDLGVPEETSQGYGTVALRQGLDWLARRRGAGAAVIARIMTAFLREVFAYMTRPALRGRARARVIEAVQTHRPRVVVAHSLGSVVAYEALHARPDLGVDLLVTVGSPLGLPEAVFDGLEPEPRDGRGARPPGVGRWVNIADPGDLVAVPARLGDRFPVDLHEEAHIGVLDFHTMAGYLGCGLTAAAVQPYA